MTARSTSLLTCRPACSVTSSRDARNDFVSPRGRYPFPPTIFRISAKQSLFLSSRPVVRLRLVARRSRLLHNALQRVLVLPGEVHDLSHFGLGHLVREDPALADAMIVYVQHNARRIILAFSEEAHDNMHDEFHRRVIVIQEQDAVEVRPLGLRPRLRDNGRAKADLSTIVLPRILRHASPPGVSIRVI